MLNGLSLFSGIGGLDVALSGYVRPIAYCEIDAHCQGVLLSRMCSNELGTAPIWDDIRSFNGSGIKGDVDIIYGGFPCQDISVAGHGKGLAGERSGLYWEIHRLAKEIIPKFIFLENVPAICTKGAWDVVSSLAEIGYDCRYDIFSAEETGAKHKRERWFCLAHANSSGRREQRGAESIQEKQLAIERDGEDVADTRFKCEGCAKESERPSFHDSRCGRFWEAEPDVGRVVDGVQFRVDRIKSLGNAVVPIQAKTAFETLMGLF
jgi:DNA (cytosine-5)-methyltransferase 1